MTQRNWFLDLYCAFWQAIYGPERYARQPDSAGQKTLFDEPAEPQQVGFTAKLYRGSGRQNESSIYKHGPGAVFQDADYFAFTPEHAAHYGPDITEHQVQLTNPRMITNDADWHALAAEAGVKPSLNVGTMNQQAIRQASDTLSAHLQSRGHDGLVVRNAQQTKWPGRIFGHDQVVRFRPDQQAGLQGHFESSVANLRAAVPPDRQDIHQLIDGFADRRDPAAGHALNLAIQQAAIQQQGRGWTKQAVRYHDDAQQALLGRKIQRVGDPVEPAPAQPATNEPDPLLSHPLVAEAKANLDKIQRTMDVADARGRKGTEDPIRMKRWTKAHRLFSDAIATARREQASTSRLDHLPATQNPLSTDLDGLQLGNPGEPR